MKVPLLNYLLYWVLRAFSSLACWCTSAFLCYAMTSFSDASNIGPDLEKLLTDFYDKIFPSIIPFIPAIVCSASVASLGFFFMYREFSGKSFEADNPFCIDNCASLSINLSFAIALVFLLIHFDFSYYCNNQFRSWDDDHIASLTIMLFSFLSWFISLITCFAYQRLATKARCTSIRYVLYWPALLTYGISILGGCVASLSILKPSWYFHPLREAESGTPVFNSAESAVYLILFAVLAVVYFISLCRDFREDAFPEIRVASTSRGLSLRLKEKDSNGFQLNAYHATLVFLTTVGCLYLGRFECLISLMLTASFAIFDAWEFIELSRIIDNRNDRGIKTERSLLLGGRRLQYLRASNIARLLLIVFIGIVVPFAFATYPINLGDIQSGALPAYPEKYLNGLKVYYIGLPVLLIILSGYIANWKPVLPIETNQQGDSKVGKLIEDIQKNSIIKKIDGRLWLLYVLRIIFFAAILVLFCVLPFVLRHQTARFWSLLRSGKAFASTMLLMTSAAGVLSLTYQIDATSKSSKGVIGLLSAMRSSFETKLQSYRFGHTYDDGNYHSVLCEVLVAAVMLTLMLGSVFIGSSEEFYCYALIGFLAFIVSYVFGFCFFRGEKRRQYQKLDIEYGQHDCDSDSEEGA